MYRTSRNSCSPATHTVCSEIFKDNQNVTNIESNILLMRSTKQRKWYFAEAVTAQTCFAKNVFWNIRQTYRETPLPGSFFRLYACNFIKKRYSWIKVFLSMTINTCELLLLILVSTWQLWPSYLILLIIFEILVYETIWWTWLANDVSQESLFSFSLKSGFSHTLLLEGCSV